MQENGPSVGFALAGGIFLFLGNLGTQYGLAFTGLSITEVVSSSITVVGGTTLNYFLDDRYNCYNHRMAFAVESNKLIYSMLFAG